MSDPISTAQEAIASTEQRLRTLIQTALEKQRYSDVAKLAPLADAVLNILKTVRNGEVALRSADTAGGGKNDDTFLPQTRIASATGRGSDAVYPRFERHGDKLVKIAWSKDRKSTRLNSSHQIISYAVFCLKKKKNEKKINTERIQ